MLVYFALIAAGVIVSCVMVASSYRIGRFVTNLECVQLRVTNRELLQMQAESRRQLNAVDDAIGRMITDPRTWEGTKLELERARELVKKRQS